jgi:hypothetical protein
MLPEIKIDITGVAQEFLLKEAQVEVLGAAVVNTLVDRIFYNWANNAKQGLNSTRKRYIQSLQIVQVTPFKKYIVLNGEFANMLESGAGAFDMKIGFAASPKRKLKKDGGWFLTVPFRHATPNALGESEIFSGVMPQEIYDVVKNFTPAISQIGTGRQSIPQRLGANQIPKPFDAKLTRVPVSNLAKKSTFEEYTHKNSIYEGMIKNSTTYEKATQGSYVTFRRVSDKSDANSWIHKGIMAGNFAQKALAQTDVGKIADRVIDEFLLSLTKA